MRISAFGKPQRRILDRKKKKIYIYIYVYIYFYMGSFVNSLKLKLWVGMRKYGIRIKYG